MKASARKSFGEFKPVIVHDDGRTEVVGKRERALVWVPGQAGMHPLPGGPTHFVRGKTFAAKADAVAYAQRHIDARIAARAEWAKRFQSASPGLRSPGVGVQTEEVS